MFLEHVFQKYDLSAGARGANSRKPLAGHDQHYIATGSGIGRGKSSSRWGNTYKNGLKVPFLLRFSRLVTSFLAPWIVGIFFYPP